MYSEVSLDYGFQQFETELTVQNIFKRVSDIILWRYYLGVDFQVGKTIAAPYRRDSTPSMGIRYSSSGKLVFKDFGTGTAGDIFDYVSTAYGLTFRQALDRINSDFKLGLGGLEVAGKRNNKVTKKEEKELIKFEKEFIYQKGNVPVFFVNPRNWLKFDLEYWERFGIALDTLKKYNVYPISRLYINGNQIYSYTQLNPGYAYVFETGHMKCYFPFSSAQRFMGNVNNYEDVQGYHQCDVKGKGANGLLILTKSMKDCMLLSELGYDAMAINGEGHYFYKDFIRHIKKYYKRIISLYDPDKSGIKGARFLWKEYRIMPFFIPRRYRDKCKDISDVCLVHGKKEAETVMKEIESQLDKLMVLTHEH